MLQPFKLIKNTISVSTRHQKLSGFFNNFFRGYIVLFHQSKSFLLLVQVTPVHCITIIFKLTKGIVLVTAYRFVENNWYLPCKIYHVISKTRCPYQNRVVSKVINIRTPLHSWSSLFALLKYVIQNIPVLSCLFVSKTAISTIVWQYKNLLIVSNINFVLGYRKQVRKICAS